VALLRLDKSISDAETNVGLEMKRHAKLLQTLTELETQANQFTHIALPPQHDSNISANEPKIDSKINVSKPAKKDSKALPAVDDAKNHTTAPLAILMYEYIFSMPIHISTTIDITEIKGVILVSVSPSKAPDEIKLTVNMKEVNRENNNATSTHIVLNRIKAKISADSSIECIYRELPQPELNEFGLPNYQRLLTFSINGNLKNKALDATLSWQELSGRPLFAKIKIPIFVK
jgi:hypothetical protein